MIERNTFVKEIIARLYQKEVKETLWSFATKLLTAVLFFAINIYLARILGVTLFGTWSFLFSNLTLVFIFSYFGVNAATRAFVARYNHTAALRIVFESSLLLRFSINILFALLFLLLHDEISVWIRHPELSELFLSATPLVFLMGFVEYLKEIFIGLHRIKYHFIVNVFEYGLKLVLTVLFLRLTFSLLSVIQAYSWAVLFAVLAGGFTYFRIYQRSRSYSPNEGLKTIQERERPHNNPAFINRILRYSLPLFFISIGFLIITEIDTLMLGVLSTDQQVGFFAVGKQIANKLPQAAFALSMGIMPIFAKLSSENATELRKKFANILKLNTLFFLPISVGLIGLSPLLIPWIYGSGYRDSVLPLQILTLWILMNTFNVFFNIFLDYQGLARRRALNFSLTMIATIGLNFLLIPPFGAVGAALSTTVAYTPYIILNGLEVRKVLRDA